MSKGANAADHIGFLDGIRGLAALWVLVAHCMIWGGWYGIPLPQPKIAVDIFMLVSGFLMVFQYRLRAAAEPLDAPSTAMRFWVRRFFRIAPAYYLFLLLIILCWSAYGAGFSDLQQANPERWANLPQYTKGPLIEMDWRNVLTHVTFVFGMLPRYSFSTLSPDWSIGLEMQFYAVFPLLYFALRKYSWVTLSLAALGLELLANRWLGHMPGLAEGAVGLFPEPSFLPLKISLFVAGMACGEVFCLQRDAPQAGTGPLPILALVIGAGHSHYVLAVIAFFLFVALQPFGAANRPEGRILHWLKSGLDNRLMRFMADTSYSVYVFHDLYLSLLGSRLFHLPWYLALRPSHRVGVLFLVVASLSYGIGALIHRFVEQPGIALGRRVSAKLFPRPTAAVELAANANPSSVALP